MKEVTNLNQESPSQNNRLLFHPNFQETLLEIKKKKIILPLSKDHELNFKEYRYPHDGELISDVEKFGKYVLDKKNGESFSKSNLICAYDESVNKFEGLEGTAYLTSHSMIIHGLSDFIPIDLLTFYFYTRSSILSKNSNYIKYSDEPEADSKRDYITDRKQILSNNAPDDSVLFIDGPLVGSQMTKQTRDLNLELIKKGIVPVFFVKNSTSNLVTDNTKHLKKQYNSDMHWSYKYLKPGERTNLFKYVDKQNPNNSKIFCYIKSFDVSPQRFEIDVVTFKKFNNIINDLLDLVFYLMLVQGDLKNPQIRSIAIAEKYARASLHLINLQEMMMQLGITPTMNQERFAW